MSENGKSYDSARAIQELAKRGVTAPVCPFCKGNKFSIAGEFAAINVSTTIGALDLGKHIPAAVIICEKCGNLQFFALARLGMIEGTEKTDK